METTKRLTLYCVLDPSRAVATYQETVGHSCWVDARLGGDAKGLSNLWPQGGWKAVRFVTHAIHTRSR